MNHCPVGVQANGTTPLSPASLRVLGAYCGPLSWITGRPLWPNMLGKLRQMALIQTRGFPRAAARAETQERGGVGQGPAWHLLLPSMGPCVPVHPQYGVAEIRGAEHASPGPPRTARGRLPQHSIFPSRSGSAPCLTPWGTAEWLQLTTRWWPVLNGFSVSCDNRLAGFCHPHTNSW